MTEDEARSWIADRFGANGVTQMTKLADLVRTESPHQNLVSAMSLDHLWSRHIVDSAQLIGLADAAPGRWLDVGTGAGFPGIVVAALTGREVVLVEPRKRRVEFLA
ncbi:MAG: RsmG family class I SAM-dependent methyltransferase, partial [Sphingomonas sp.]